MPYIPPGLELLTQQMYGDYQDDPSGSPMGIATGQRKSLQDTIDAIYSNYKPEHRFSDQLAQMLSTYPTRTEPSRTQRILSGIASLQPHAQAVVGGQPVGYTATDPIQFQQAQEQFNYGPFYRSMNDWMNKVKPIEEGARDERYLNTNMRTLLGNEARSAVSANRAETAALNEQSLAKRRESQNLTNQQDSDTRAWLAKHPKATETIQPDGTVIFSDPIDGTSFQARMRDTGEPVKTTSKLQEIAAQGANQQSAIAARGGQERQNIRARGEQQRLNIAAQEKAKTEYAEMKAQVDNQFKFTAQTKAMMEGAQMLLPHVKDLHTQATALAREGLFGPVASRLRELSAKIGTSGTPEDIQKTLDDVAYDLKTNPVFNTDFAVSQFSSNLALMASGMGRVHGGARGGGSIQMINYLKEVLAGTGSFNSFEGRLKTLDSYLTGYAKGPQKPTDDKIKSAIADILKGK